MKYDWLRRWPPLTRRSLLTVIGIGIVCAPLEIVLLLALHERAGNIVFSVIDVLCVNTAVSAWMMKRASNKRQ